MNKYQDALNKIIRSCCPYCYDDNGCQNCEIKQTCNATAKNWVDTLQELVDREKSLTPTYKNTYIEYKEHYLDKDYEMKYHCPKCDSIVYPIGRCTMCHQNLDWNKYFIIEGRSYRNR